MCLAVPGKVMEITGDTPMEREGRIAFSGVVKTVSLAFLPEAVVGDYVLVHAGVAISRLDEAQALKTLADLESLEEAS